jgi:autotransporter strand-loop-strand O-heptosyltransferase
MENEKKFEKSFLLYGNENYLPIIKKTIKSIRSFSDLPIFVYLLNYFEEISEENVYVKKLQCDIRKSNTLYNKNDDGSFYIDRNQVEIYDTLIQRPFITKDVLENYSNTVCYLDADTTCLSNLEKIFNLYPTDETVPYFTKGVYDFMYWDGVGNSGDDLTKTLEHPTCELYNIDQSFRYQAGYHQTGYFIAGQNSLPFINEWMEMCYNPVIKNNTVKYAAYHEETIANCLLWKYKVDRGLPHVYVNGTLETIDLINDDSTFTGKPTHIKDWLVVPSKREELFFIHGEKRLDVIDNMIDKLKGVYYKNIKISDVGYVINLPHRTDRKENVIKLFNQLEITGYKFIDGIVLEDPDLKKFGCTKTFINIFKEFLKTDNQNLIIFEDDIKLMNGVLDADINKIFNGWDEITRTYDVVSLGTKLLPRSEIKMNGDNHGSFEEMLCAHSFFYHRNFVEHLVSLMSDFLNPENDFYKCAIDMFLNDCSSSTYRFIHNEKHKKFNFGITAPMLFTQGPSFSDNEQKEQDYEDDIEQSFWESLNKSKINKKMKLLYITPHLSTGGMPQFVLKRIQELQKYKNEIEIFLVEYSQFSDTYVVQRNQIIDIIGKHHFFTLGASEEKERKYELLNIIRKNKIDIVHFEEISEGFEGFNRIPFDMLNEIYANNRTYKIVETCHNVWFNPDNRKLSPDAYCLVTPYHLEQTFKPQKAYKELITYPYEDKVSEIKNLNEIYSDEHRVPMIEKVKTREELGIDAFKTHVMNVGLWTEGKNQKEGVEVARIIWEKNKDIHFHFIGNQAPNFENYWGPIMKDLPPNVTVWNERDDVDRFMKACDVMMFNSTWECNPLVLRESVNYGMKIMARNLPQYMGMFDNYITNIEGDYNLISDTLLKLITSKETYKIETEENFGDKMFRFYNTVLENIPLIENKKIENDYSFINHYVINPYLELNGQTDNPLNVRFYDNNSLSYESNVNINSWVKMNKEYYTNWRVEVRENDELIYRSDNNYKDKRVYISFGSSSLGDTLAWIPYCEEFRKKHDCKLVVTTFMNNLFIDQYPEIEFVEPGEVVNGIIAQYRLGWFYDENSNYDISKHPQDFKKLPLQQTATDILGLEYTEIKAKLKLPNIEKKKKIGIGFHSTAQSKYWNNPNGWQQVIDYLNNFGYECMIYSREGDGYMGNFHPKGVTTFKGGSIQDVIDDLATCEFFIGLGSGLSWLAWSVGLPVVLISGFSEKWAETRLDTYRVINESVCHGCFNWDRLDAGDWNWCPKHKGTKQQFECTKEISSKMVIDKINIILNLTKGNTLTDFDWGFMNDNNSFSEYHKKAITEEIFNNNIYEKMFKVEEGDVVMDIGSSIGPFTKSIIHKNPKHVYCVEPSQVEFKTLVKNTFGGPVTLINKGVGSTNGIIESNQLFGGENFMEVITFGKLLDLYNVDKIDFLKLDCEGGEYDIFNSQNIDFITRNVKKISGEWHLATNELKSKFRNFRDTYLTKFNNYEIYSVDGIDIKWDLWNDHFIEFYNEVIIHIDNR